MNNYKDQFFAQSNRIYEFQEKFIYYILAIDATCIGFDLNFVKDEKLSWQIIPFTVSILLWAVSFYMGIKGLQLSELSHIERYNFYNAKIQDEHNIARQHNSNNNDLSLRIKKFDQIHCFFYI